MSHEETLYARFISGELSQEEIQALKLSGEWEELEAIRIATENLGLAEFDVDRGFEELVQQKTNVPKRDFRIIWQVVSIAASLALLVIVFNVFQNREVKLNASFAENKSILLPDESEITLNDGSSITYNKKNWEENRKVNLIGEAVFEVKKGKRFMVQTKNGDVEVLGTRFNVRSWGDVLSIECYSGSVAVNTEMSSDTLVKYQTIYFVNGDKRSISVISNDEPLWINNRSVFKEEKLVEVLNEIERQFGVEVNNENIVRRFSGSFQHQSLNQALEQVCKPLGLQFEIQKESKIVRVFE